MKVLLLAGEESGLLYAEKIRARLAERVQNVEIRGYADYGFEISDLAVMGFFAVLRRLFFFLRVKRTMERAIDSWRPDVVCTVDYPGLNLKLAAHAKARGIRAVHVVCPQVWAWKAGRIPKIEASLDRLCCFFPFEPALFREGFATFVGHPLAEDFRTLRGAARSPTDRPLVAMLPGSRVGEVMRILPTLLGAAAELSRRHPDGVRFVIPAANERTEALIRRLVAEAPLGGAVEIRTGGARELLVREATCAAVASGTATLEAALAGCPTVLVYRVSALLGWFARHAIKGIRHVGLANIIAEKANIECPMPELLQEDLTVEGVTEQLERWLFDVPSREATRARLMATTDSLVSSGDSMTRITDFLI